MKMMPTSAEAFSHKAEAWKLPAKVEREANNPNFLFGAVAYEAEQVGAPRRKSK